MGFRDAAAAPLLLLLLAGCEDPAAPLVIGRKGTFTGEFEAPRGIAASGDRLAVVDRSGRLQEFTADGAFVRAFPVMPEGSRRGFPLGVRFDGDGFLVAHTHDAALVRYGAEGKEISRFGNEGVKDGEFCMPQRVVPFRGNLIVSEFGYAPCCRVQEFALDGKFLRRFPGTFHRPMGVAVDEAGILWVADTGGKVVRYEAATGRLLGPVADPVVWPTGVAALPGGGVVVVEAGNHRLHRFAADGRSLGTFGRNGSLPGEFNTPYDVAVAPPWIFVADTENHRVQRFRLDAIPWEPVP
jgi:hypothetical protein